MAFYKSFTLSQHLFILLLFAFCKLGSQETIRSDEPIILFKLPHFGENGLIDWDIQGDQGKYSPKRIEISKLVFRLFDNQQPPQPKTIINSPHALILPNEQIAKSEDSIEINNAQFQLTGQKWEWDGHANKITIHRKVEIFFPKGMINILK